MERVRGYTRRGRKLSAAVFIPLFLLFLVMTLIYGEGLNWVGPAVGLALTALLFTKLWWLFYPVLCAGFSLSGALMAIPKRDYVAILIAAFFMYLGVAITVGHIRARLAGRELE